MLIASAGALAVVLSIVVAQNAEVSEAVTETMMGRVVETRERVINEFPQVKKYLEQAA